MNPQSIIILITAYFAVLIGVSYLTTRNIDSKSFYLGNRKSPWYLVAFGMIGASLSGVTFISVPGWVNGSQFSYFQMVLGYLLGYVVVAEILIPLYYKLNLTTIYGYLEQRFGKKSYKTGAAFFLLSRSIGSAFRLYLVAMVLQLAVFDALEIPFWITVSITIFLIWVYTFKGGIKTIIITDTFQTLVMLLAVVFTIFIIGSELNLTFSGIFNSITSDSRSQIFFFDSSTRNFFTQFFSGAFITITMTGLDQDMMQKNLSCKNLSEAKKNIYSYSITLILVNLLFLGLGVLLFQYAEVKGINLPSKSDELYPLLALNYLGPIVATLFILGLIAAAYSSADSAMAALTTSVCVDFLDFEKGKESPKTRTIVHLLISLAMIGLILLFKLVNNDSVISELFKAAGFTYGPLLGLFAFGLFTSYKVKDFWVPFICVLSPIISFILNFYSKEIFPNNYQIGFEIIIINGALTFLGLFLTKEKNLLITK